MNITKSLEKAIGNAIENVDKQIEKENRPDLYHAKKLQEANDKFFRGEITSKEFMQITDEVISHLKKSNENIGRKFNNLVNNIK